MRLFRQYIYRLAKEDIAGSLCRRIGEALEKAGTPAARSLFFFSDSAHGKVSVVDRCAKRYPSLASSGLTLTDSMGQQSRALTNLPAPWDETNPTAGINPEWALLAEIGEGIPRSYPFHYALMIADGIDWFKTGIKVREPALHEQKPSCHIPHAYLSPSIGVYNNWWTPHRMAGLWATVEIEEPPSDAPPAPGIPRFRR